jgi:enoyl-CoA hydratase/carnithine racemase
MAYTGEAVDANEAERIGLVEEIVPAPDLMKRSLDLAKRIAMKPPLAVSLAKQMLFEGMTEPDLASQLSREFYQQYALIDSEDVKEGVESFLQKRKPVFKGR